MGLPRQIQDFVRREIAAAFARNGFVGDTFDGSRIGGSHTATPEPHNLFSDRHPDVDSTDAPTNGDVLTYDGEAGKWVALPAGSDGASFIGAGITHSADQSIANNTVTVLAFDTELFDTDTIHDTATNNSRLTCKTAGKYIITAHVEWATPVTGQRIVGIRQNGTDNIAWQRLPSTTVSGNENLSVAVICDLAVNDYVECVVFQNSGGALNCLADPNDRKAPLFSMALLGA